MFLRSLPSCSVASISSSGWSPTTPRYAAGCCASGPACTATSRSASCCPSRTVWPTIRDAGRRAHLSPTGPGRCDVWAAPAGGCGFAATWPWRRGLSMRGGSTRSCCSGRARCGPGGWLTGRLSRLPALRPPAPTPAARPRRRVRGQATCPPGWLRGRGCSHRAGSAPSLRRDRSGPGGSPAAGAA